LVLVANRCNTCDNAKFSPRTQRSHELVPKCLFELIQPPGVKQCLGFLSQAKPLPVSNGVLNKGPTGDIRRVTIYCMAFGESHFCSAGEQANSPIDRR